MKKNNSIAVYYPKIFLSANFSISRKVSQAIQMYNMDMYSAEDYENYVCYLKNCPDHFVYVHLRIDDYDLKKVLTLCQLFDVPSASRTLSFMVFSSFSGVSVLGGRSTTPITETHERGDL